MEVFNKMILMNYFATLNPVAFTNALPGNIAQGLIWGIMALGVYITFRLLDFADLTVDGSFATGGAVTVMMTINGYNIWVSLLCACIAGLLAGLCTGLLHTKLGIPPILAGILTQIALYSINLNIMQRHANQALSADKYNLVLSSRNLTHAIIVGVIFSVVIIAVLYWYFGTEQGSAIRATGCNPAMSKAQGINIDNMKLIGLALSNAIVALSGGLLSQYSGFSDVNMGRGGIVIGLAAVIIGEVLGDAILGKHMNFMGKLIFVIFGGIVYYIVIGIVLWLQMPSDDLKLFTAIIVAIFLAVPYLKGKSKASFKKAGKRSAAALNAKEGKKMLEIRNVHKTFNPGTINEKHALNGVNLKLEEGDFVTVIGGNGAGKSTMLNAVAGTWPVDDGSILIDGVDVTGLPEFKRASFLGRVFQDPMTGTTATMQIDENLALAARRGKRRGLGWGITKAEKEHFHELLKELDLGLEDRMTSKVGLLSGGQRQAVTLLMASLQKPKVLLLDEHTAALDPKTASKVLALTDKIIKENSLTAMMVTHNMRDAIAHGNRLIMMNNGQVVLNISGEEKKNLTVEDLLMKFEEVSGEEFASDKALLG